MSETKTDTAPAVTMRWEMRHTHIYRFQVADWREQFIKWLDLPDTASDEDVAAALMNMRTEPTAMVMELEEIASSEPLTWTDGLVDSVNDIELHNVTPAGES